MYLVQVVISFCLILPYFTSANACKGCLSLDEYSFKKIVPKFKAVLVKFDVAYPYGDKHEIFSSVATDIIDNKDLIVALAGVKDYGEKENLELAKKYGLNGKDDLPALRLFVKGQKKPFELSKDDVWTAESIKKLIRDNTDIYIGLPGCLETFDKLAIDFVSSSTKDERIKQAEAEIEKLMTDEEIETANKYLKFMKKIVEIGTQFIRQEVKRLNKIVKDGKVNESKKKDLSLRLNILSSFNVPKDEL